MKIANLLITLLLVFSGANSANSAPQSGPVEWTQLNGLSQGIILAGLNCALVVNDGTDQTANLQACLTLAATEGQKLQLPVGTITVNATGITVPENVWMAGVNTNQPYFGQTTNTYGTTITSTTNTGSNPLITMSAASMLTDITVIGTGSDGYGGSTTRNCIQLSGVLVRIFDTSAINCQQALNGNGQGQAWVAFSNFSSSQTGLLAPVDSHFDHNVFASDGTGAYLGAGSNHNTFTGNRFEYSRVGHCIGLDGTYGTNTTYTTNGSTSSSSPTLHFAASSIPNVAVGQLIYDTTTTGGVTPGTYVSAVNNAAGTVTMSVNAAATVNGSDAVQFYLPSVSENVITGNSFDACWLNAISVNIANGTVISGNHFIQSSYGATANTVNDAEISLYLASSVTISGNVTQVGTAGQAHNVPSFGVWDAGGNWNDAIKGNTFAWTPVDGTHGAGINSTTTFSNFNTDNSVAKAVVVGSDIGVP